MSLAKNTKPQSPAETIQKFVGQIVYVCRVNMRSREPLYHDWWGKVVAISEHGFGTPQNPCLLVLHENEVILDPYAVYPEEISCPSLKYRGKKFRERLKGRTVNWGKMIKKSLEEQKLREEEKLRKKKNRYLTLFFNTPGNLMCWNPVRNISYQGQKGTKRHLNHVEGERIRRKILLKQAYEADNTELMQMFLDEVPPDDYDDCRSEYNSFSLRFLARVLELRLRKSGFFPK